MSSVLIERVLVVDDDPLTLSAMRDLLSGQGFAATTAASALEASDYLSKELPDVILLDIQMPDLDGLEFLTRLRDDKRTRSIPIIMVTALDDNEYCIRGLDGGAFDYMTKPVNPDTLISRIRSHLTDPHRFDV